MPTVGMQLREIAGDLRTRSNLGEFAGCQDGMRQDMENLPAELERIADQADRVAVLFPATPKVTKPRRKLRTDTIGGRIATTRRDRGMTQEKLAVALGVSRSAVAQWETDRAAPSYAHLLRLNETLRADLLINPEASQ